MSTAYASKSNSVPESGPQQHNERHIDMDEDIEYSLDYETGLLKTSSVSCTIPSMIATSSTNDEDTAGRLFKRLLMPNLSFEIIFLQNMSALANAVR